jgi:hypothetical protein
MSELIDDADGGVTPKDSLGIHFFEAGAAILDGFAGDDFQPFEPGDGFFAAVGFEIADHHVDAAAVELLGILEHLVGLANTGGVA